MLLEMVVVVVVIGIFFGIVIFSYQNYVICFNCIEGQVLFLDVVVCQECYYLQNFGVGYIKDVVKLGMSLVNLLNNLYNFIIVMFISIIYILIVMLINLQICDKICGKLIFNQFGECGVVGKIGNNSIVNDCWC